MSFPDDLNKNGTAKCRAVQDWLIESNQVANEFYSFTVERTE